MGSGWEIEMLPEVGDWYKTLPMEDRAITKRMLDLLAEQGNKLRMPHSKPLREGLFELRFDLEKGAMAQRITYIFEPKKKIITLTEFYKSKNNERKEVKRARKVKKDYENDHKND